MSGREYALFDAGDVETGSELYVGLSSDGKALIEIVRSNESFSSFVLTRSQTRDLFQFLGDHSQWLV